jgi:uncharacterized protein (DUF2267 family)
MVLAIDINTYFFLYIQFWKFKRWLNFNQTMGTKFKKGDRVKWKVGKGETTGEIVKKVTESTTVEGKKITATKSKPRYLVKNDNTGSVNAYGAKSLSLIKEDVPDLINPEEVDFRVANTFGAPDGPLPHLIKFKKAELTEKGVKMLERMEKEPPEAIKKGPSTAIASKDLPFLEKVMLKGELEDIFDARDMTEMVFRVMRDLMTTEAADRVAEELHEPAEVTETKALQQEITDLWKDTNPIVGFLSRVRPPWQGPGIFKIDSDRFLFRVKNEGGMPQSANVEQVVNAVFSATKEELSEERIKEIDSWMPEGKVKELWEQA